MSTDKASERAIISKERISEISKGIDIQDVMLSAGARSLTDAGLASHVGTGIELDIATEALNSRIAEALAVLFDEQIISVNVNGYPDQTPADVGLSICKVISRKIMRGR